MAKNIKETTKVIEYLVNGDAVKAFNVPEEIFTAMNLQANELLEFEYDVEAGRLVIQRKFAVLNEV